jgi:hypothetical protein
MVDTVEVAIEAALLAEIKAFAATQSPTLTVAYPNTPFSPPVSTGTQKYPRYLRAQIFPIDTAPIGIPHDSWNRHEGIFQIDVFYAIEAGALEPGRLAQRVIEHFDRGKEMTRDGVTVKVYERPSHAGRIPSGAWEIIPVRIRYLTFVKP